MSLFFTGGLPDGTLNFRRKSPSPSRLARIPEVPSKSPRHHKNMSTKRKSMDTSSTAAPTKRTAHPVGDTTLLACTLVEWLQVYNGRAIQLMTVFLGIPVHPFQKCRSITLCAPCGAILRTVSITPTTTVEDICLHGEQLFLEGVYEIPLESTSLVWDYVPGDGQLTVVTFKFEGILDRLLKGHTHRVHSVNWHPDGTKLASGSYDSTVRIWDVNSSKCIAVCGCASSVNTVQWNPSGTTLANGANDTTIRIWNTTSRECLCVLQGHTNCVYSIAWHPSGNWMASGSSDNTIRIWELTSSGTKCLHVLRGHTGPVSSVHWGPTSVVTSMHWNPSGTQLASGMHWNPSGTQLASGYGDGAIRIWDIDSLTGKCVQVLKGHTDAVCDVQWNPTGTLLASGSWDTTIHIWKTDTWDWTTILKGHTNIVSSITWNPAGTLLASGSPDRTIRVWGADTWKCLHVLQCGKLIHSIEWNPHGTSLASGSIEGIIQIWR